MSFTLKIPCLLAIDGECSQTHQPRTTFSHAQLFRSLVVLSFMEKQSSSQAHFMSHVQCTWLDRIPLLLFPLRGSISCNQQHGVQLRRLAEHSSSVIQVVSCALGRQRQRRRRMQSSVHRARCFSVSDGSGKVLGTPSQSFLVWLERQVTQNQRTLRSK